MDDFFFGAFLSFSTVVFLKCAAYVGSGAKARNLLAQGLIKPCLEHGYTQKHCVSKAKEIGIDFGYTP